jgi:hypothetical protein
MIVIDPALCVDLISVYQWVTTNRSWREKFEIQTALESHSVFGYHIVDFMR